MSYIETAKQNKIDGEELKAYRAQTTQRQMEETANFAREAGSNEAYDDVMRQMEASNLFNAAPAYAPQQAPAENFNVGLLDEVEGKLGSADSWYNNAIDSATAETAPIAADLGGEGRAQATQDFERLLSNQ